MKKLFVSEIIFFGTSWGICKTASGSGATSLWLKDINTGAGAFIYFFNISFSSVSIYLIVSSSFILLERTGTYFGVASSILFFIGDAVNVYSEDYLLMIFFAEEASLFDIFFIDELIRSLFCCYSN